MKNYLFEKISLFLAFFLIVLVSFVSFGYAFDSGDGSMGDPYQIASCADLAEVNDHLDDYFLLMSNLDCSGSGNSIMIWNPSSTFWGEFDGGDHTITIALTDIGDSYVGLFRRVNSGTIKNLSIQWSVDAWTYSYVGGLVGYVEWVSVIENITVDANLTWWHIVWGVVWYMYSSSDSWTIDRVIFQWSVYSTYGRAGWIVWQAYNWAINEAYASWTVTSQLSIFSFGGGIVGSFNNWSIQQVGFYWSILGDSEEAGGIAWDFNNATLSDCYVNWSVHWYYFVWGLVWYTSTTSVSRCYVSATVSATYTEADYIRPLLWYESSVTNTGLFWNEELYTGNVWSTGTWVSEEELQDIQTYTNAGWDVITSVEDFLGNGNPYLAWQVGEDDAVWYIPGLEIQTDLSIAIEDEGVTGGNTYAHSYEIAYTNSGVDMENIVIYLSGNILFGNVMLGVGTPDISAHVDGSYVAWTGLSLLSGETKYLTFVITHPTAWNYPYSVLIDSTDTYTDVDTGNNHMDITTFVVPPKSGQWSSVSTTNTTTTSNDESDETTTDDDETTDETDSTESSTSESGTESWTASSGVEEDNDASDGTCEEAEYNEAYVFGFAHSLTTLSSCQEANMDGLLLRKHAAKIMSNYAVNVLWKSPDTEKVCNFDDMWDEDEEMNKYVRIACQLGIMGLQWDGVTPLDAFNPNGFVDKAQFGTVLSRLLYGNTYDNNAECRYCDHMDALKEAGIITVTTDLLETLRRGYALLMLMRATDTD